MASPLLAKPYIISITFPSELFNSWCDLCRGSQNVLPFWSRPGRCKCTLIRGFLVAYPEVADSTSSSHQVDEPATSDPPKIGCSCERTPATTVRTCHTGMAAPAAEKPPPPRPHNPLPAESKRRWKRRPTPPQTLRSEGGTTQPTQMVSADRRTHSGHKKKQKTAPAKAVQLMTAMRSSSALRDTDTPRRPAARGHSMALLVKGTCLSSVSRVAQDGDVTMASSTGPADVQATSGTHHRGNKYPTTAPSPREVHFCPCESLLRASRGSKIYDSP